MSDAAQARAPERAARHRHEEPAATLGQRVELQARLELKRALERELECRLHGQLALYPEARMIRPQFS